MKNLSKYDLKFNTAIERWDEAIPLGNGKLGSLIYGDGPLKIAVDRGDLWDNRPDSTIFEDSFNFQNLIKLSRSGKDEDWDTERYRLFELTSRRYPYPTKLTAGRLEIDFGFKTKSIKSELSLQNAYSSIQIGENNAARVEAFLSATRFVGALRVYGKYNLNLHIPDYFSGDENGESKNNSGINTLRGNCCLFYPKAKIHKEKNFLYYTQKTHTGYTFGIVTLTLKKAGYDEIYYTVATSDYDINYIEKAKIELLECSNAGYDALLSEHVAWWKKYWQKSEITLGDELFEKTYYRSYYIFASCSREGFPPMPLQGVWTADNDSVPPWNGDYHHDTNTEMSYQSYLKANRLNEGRAFVDYIWSLRDTFRSFTKRFFKVPGVLLPGTTSLDGTPIAGWAHYTLSPTMTIWVGESFDEYWLYTADRNFLKTRAYPFFKDAEKAIFRLLEEKDGKLYLPLSSSPEIFDNERRAYLEPNSNFDLALLIYLYKTLIRYCDELDIDKKHYVEVLAKLDDIATNDEHMIMLDPKQNLNESHRHFSHLMCLYPLHLINYDTEENKLIYKQTMLNLERLGTGWWVGFSFPMCAQLFAMMHNGGGAYEKLRIFAKGCVADNGFHLNGDFKHLGFSQWHYRPFTLESLFGFCDAVQEMLLQEHLGYVDLFPAIPEEWEKKVSFKRLRSYGGVLVSAEYENGKTKKAVFESRRNIKIKILNNFGKDSIIIETNGKIESIKVAVGEIFEINLSGKITVSTI